MSINFESICRLCMMHANSMIQLFDGTSSLSKKIMMLVPTLKIFAEDNLPRQVCEECANQVNNFDRFKVKCEISDLRLKQYLTNLQFERKKNITEEAITSTKSNPRGKVNENKKIENDCKKEDGEDSQLTEVKEEDAEEFKYDVIKAEPEIEFTIPVVNQTNIIKDISLNKTESNSSRTTELTKPLNILCPICGKLVVRRRITNHVKRHTVGRPYKCEDCGKMYIDQSSLKTHSVIHSGLKVHMCDICGKRFKLMTHLKNHHLTHTGQKSYVCDVCGKGFIQIGNLKKHEIIHTGEKPFRCDYCGKSFSDKSTLQIHIAIHAGQRKHECNICGKGFLTKGNLNSHIVVHSGEKRFSCDICGNIYARGHSLKKHKAKHNIHK